MKIKRVFKLVLFVMLGLPFQSPADETDRNGNRFSLGLDDSKTNAVFRAANAPMHHVKTYGVAFQAVRTNDGIILYPLRRAHPYILDQFAIEESPAESPTTFILSGVVKGRETKTATEQLPVFFGSATQPVRLAAVTDAAGYFSFTVAKKGAGIDCELQSLSLTNADLYLANTNIYHTDSLESDMRLRPSILRKYSIARLLKQK